ncbi:hypothetical protein AGR2A_pb10101 [Agrobacterium genomosp. 2 str. CFBP 5494]|uniref:Uncharacterized protein n=1 Tax=Agrobacterium genomosp. 2 str. CFBP 5494 TaxID=1183436 RepID=A0A9W5F344_9HYPH|nr:hypothetical protein AGR2A_pb10101 [Agrobacterium genomosp. 2 str. CFBP 5494]
MILNTLVLRTYAKPESVISWLLCNLVVVPA